MRSILPLPAGLALAGLTLAVGACQASSGGSIPFDRLSEYGYFEGPLADLQPADGVLPFRVVSPLWADHADKARFVVLPEGGTIDFNPGELWGFPDGSVVVKNFFFDLDRQDPGGEARIIETRLLSLEEGSWQPYTYVWDDAQTDAEFRRAGDRIDVDFIDADGNAATQEYLVPNTDECDSCHARDGETQLLGPITHQLNFEGILGDGSTGNQIEWFADAGAFSGPIPDVATLPALEDPAGSGDLDARARSYLHANCSHCHREGGGAEQSGLHFPIWNDDPFSLGVCKEPAAAGAGTGGREWDIVPGAPDESIVPFRMASTDPDIKMPEIPNRLADDFGVTLIRDWIAAMPAQSCDGP